ncbi:MAG TPA: hypothetical protein VHA82_16655 [Ramlibacter sp.]|uniref:hypothetical protein n=1 Tax=Ramlibacter sp. TaxID=1917967 RepID=UPI002BE10937|nr:hypothetical protein [Ramlibacter sp.]HVZ45444.1 hypothetical protein [Ramlibacter sp.]
MKTNSWRRFRRAGERPAIEGADIARTAALVIASIASASIIIWGDQMRAPARHEPMLVTLPTVYIVGKALPEDSVVAEVESVKKVAHQGTTGEATSR